MLVKEIVDGELRKDILPIEDIVKPSQCGDENGTERCDEPSKVVSEQTSSEPENAEEIDDEEEFIQCLEKEEEENKKNMSGKALAQDKEEAPTLLRAALKKGECAEQSPKAKRQKTEEGTDENVIEEPTAVNARENQLDFLLSKASEYSNFIATDLEELQQAKAKEAEQTLKKKKRKGGDVNVGSTAIFTQPKNLGKGCVLKDYQLEGVRWIVSLYENGVSGILADEMGLGKTIQVISVIAHLRTMKVPGPFLIVVPLATLPNWIREFKKWLPSQPLCRYHGNDRHLLWKGKINPRQRKSPTFPIIITSYEISIRDKSKLQKLGEITLLVVDEGHRLKNHRCTLISSLKQIQASNRLLLSGTPIQNNLDELWSLLNFVNPAIFDDLSVFQSWFGFRDIDFRSKKNYTSQEQILLEQRNNNTISKLHDILRPFLLRRVKRDVLKDLPPKRELVVYASMSKLQSGYHSCIEEETLKETLKSTGIENVKNVSEINKQMNHRKNCNHPFLFGEPLDPTTGLYYGSAFPELLVRASGKFALLDRMLLRLYKDNHQVLIFSQMTQLLNVIEDYLNWRQWKFCRIDGSTQVDERQRQMDVFNNQKTDNVADDDRFFVFLLSTRAGGLGINLATADTCIIFDSDWNPHQDSQAMDRCHRIGQTRPVAVYRLLVIGSVDIEMMEKQISKKKLERMAIVGGDFRKAGLRSRGNFDNQTLKCLLTDDIKDLQTKGLTDNGAVIQIDDQEFDAIMDRSNLFKEGDDALPKEGKMYDIIDSVQEGLLGAIEG